MASANRFCAECRSGTRAYSQRNPGSRYVLVRVYCSCIIIIRNESKTIEFVMKRGFGESFLCGVPLGNEGIFAKESGLKVRISKSILFLYYYH